MAGLLLTIRRLDDGRFEVKENGSIIARAASVNIDAQMGVFKITSESLDGESLSKASTLEAKDGVHPDVAQRRREVVLDAEVTHDDFTGGNDETVEAEAEDDGSTTLLRDDQAPD